ncbi:hypothetical protein B0H65DRAFT_455094 [Neurospora tetraspora]|uniref:Uncharacterized protein n=1 Tax=Neurospora tetraspora TaxID=94610 RepID=A0AAE0MTM5_9PEZI|nr:hypothetical protein B0H65DRAFT_455094 [Neurospora tetraspora]
MLFFPTLSCFRDELCSTGLRGTSRCLGSRLKVSGDFLIRSNVFFVLPKSACVWEELLLTVLVAGFRSLLSIARCKRIMASIFSKSYSPLLLPSRPMMTTQLAFPSRVQRLHSPRLSRLHETKKGY